MKKLYGSSAYIVLLILLVLCFGGWRADGSEVLYADGIIAVVENKVITYSMVLQETAYMEMVLERQLAPEEFQRRAIELREEALESLVNNMLLYVEFKDRGYQVPGANISQQLNQLIRQEADGDRTAFEAMLYEHGLTIELLREQIERQIATEIMFDREVRGHGRVTEGEIRRFHSNNQNQFMEPERILARLIFLSGQNRSSHQLAQISSQVEKRLQAGDDFEILGVEVTDDQRLLEPVWIDTETINPRWAALAYRLPLHQPSPPLSGADGVFFMKIEEKEGRRLQPLSRVRNVIEQALVQHRQQEAYDSLIADLRRKFHVRIYE